VIDSNIYTEDEEYAKKLQEEYDKEYNKSDSVIFHSYCGLTRSPGTCLEIRMVNWYDTYIIKLILNSTRNPMDTTREL
jgi:hypothetical protein